MNELNDASSGAKPPITPLVKNRVRQKNVVVALVALCLCIWCRPSADEKKADRRVKAAPHDEVSDDGSTDNEEDHPPRISSVVPKTAKKPNAKRAARGGGTAAGPDEDTSVDPLFQPLKR